PRSGEARPRPEGPGFAGSARYFRLPARPFFNRFARTTQGADFPVPWESLANVAAGTMLRRVAGPARFRASAAQQKTPSTKCSGFLMLKSRVVVLVWEGEAPA